MHELSMEQQLASSRAAGGAVAEGEAKFRALMESASQAIVAVNHKGLIELVNHKVEELFGYTDDELIGHSLEMLLPEALRERHARHRKDYFSRPKVRPMGIGLNLAGRRKNGQEFPIEISLNYVEVGGHSLAISFITDISTRIRLEQEIRQSQKMEAVGQLAGGVAHDFNNLLTVIQGYSAMVLAGLKPDDTFREPLEEIEKAAARAAALTRQLLTFSHRQVVVPRVLNLNTVINEIDKMLRRVAAAIVFRSSRWNVIITSDAASRSARTHGPVHLRLLQGQPHGFEHCAARLAGLMDPNSKGRDGHPTICRWRPGCDRYVPGGATRGPHLVGFRA